MNMMSIGEVEDVTAEEHDLFSEIGCAARSLERSPMRHFGRNNPLSEPAVANILT